MALPLSEGYKNIWQRITCLFLVLVLFCVLYILTDPSSRHPLMLPEHKPVPPLVIHGSATSSRPKWVILHTYMRGGSTLLGSIFDEYNDAFYWFEPIQGVYHAAIGSQLCSPPILIHSHNNDHNRSLTQFENQAIISYIKNLLSCRLEEMPVEFFLSFMERTRVGQSYMKCMNCDEARKCYAFLPKECQTTNVWLNLKNNCHVFMSMAHTAKFTIPDYDSTRPTIIPNQLQYLKCIQPWHMQHQKCVLSLQQACQKSKLRVAKVIRSNSWLTPQILRNEDSYIVYLIRDPRGIVMSRQKNHLLSMENITQEAEVLCKKMSMDLHIFQNLAKSAQNRILILKYENLAYAPDNVLHQVFKFLDQAIPIEVENFFLNLDKDVVGEEPYSVYRKNRTSTANAWKKTITKGLKEQLDKVCTQFLIEADYAI